MKSKNRTVSPSAERLPLGVQLGERRQRRRRPTSGQISIVFRNPVFTVVKAEGKDWSPDGFRACHKEPRLISGLEVRFCAEDCAGDAVVVWTRSFEDHFESGFSIRSHDAEH